LKSNFKIKDKKKEEMKKPEKMEEEKPDTNFTDLWSFRSKKRQKL
tara:strand:+ start:13271 stop:13405 length:135 start_codon:yes stop_codon:yes gene_type:complete